MTRSLLKIDALVKRYGAFTATDHADLDIHENEIHALIGPNGAGKSTLANLISGGLTANAGTITLDGQILNHLPAHKRARMGIGRGFQVASLFAEETVLDNVAIARHSHLGRTMTMFDSHRSRRDILEQSREILAETGLKDRMDIRVSDLSHGERKQLDLIMARALGPRLLLLDEPMAGLGHAESQNMLTTLQSLRGQVSILLIEHDMDAVFSLADRISVLVYGRVIATGTVDEIRSNEDVRSAYLGHAED